MDYNEKIPHIVYASDEKFAEIMGVSMVSLFENNRDMEDIVVYILDSGIKSESKVKIEMVCKMFDRALPIWIPAKDISKELNMKITLDRGSLSQYARLFVSSVLPSELSRVLYLDCDIIINQSIYELWNLNLEGKTIGALMDAFSEYYRANIGLKPSDVMFNSGVMLIDLEKWKKDKVEDELMNFISEHRGVIQQGDQGALNAVLVDDIYCFEPRFNSVTIFYDFTYDEMMIYRRPPKFYSREEVAKAIESPVLIHYTTSFLSKRPWIKGSKHKYVEHWIKYKKNSPWAEKELWDDNRQLWKKVATKIYLFLPKCVALRIASIFQVCGRPLLYKLRMHK